MADFSFLSDSDDEKAVQELLSQAMDHSVLEQVASINCSAFTDSSLPPNLETRFRKLKTFPAPCPNPSNLTAISKSFNLSQPIDHPGKAEEKGLQENSNSPSKSETQNPDFSNSKKNPDIKTDSDPKSRSGSSSFSADSLDLRTEPLSPPAKTGCFWCSPKKLLKKGKENRGINKSDAKLLSDLSSLSEKMLKKAMKEEEKISREAEKIVQWAKQASAKMEFAGLDDELSDNGR